MATNGGAMGVRDVAAMLGRSVQSVRLYARYNGLPHRREGSLGVLRFDRGEVEEWSRRPEVAAMMAIGERVRGREWASRLQATT